MGMSHGDQEPFPFRVTGHWNSYLTVDQLAEAYRQARDLAHP